jgi:hypothetical protein
MLSDKIQNLKPLLLEFFNKVFFANNVNEPEISDNSLSNNIFIATNT